MNKSKGLVVLALVALVGTGMYVKNAGAKEGMPSLTALDYVQIEQLYSHYNHYVDSGKDDGRAYASLFTPDGVFNTNLPSLGSIRGSAELAAHHAVNIMIDPSPEGATGSAYLLMISSPEPGKTVTGLSAIYSDTFVKTSEGWKFKTRTMNAVTSPKKASASE